MAFSCDDLRDLLVLLEPACLKWFMIGVQLKVEETDLRIIEGEHDTNPRRCLYEVLHRWLISLEPSTCEELIAALVREEEDNLAQALGLKYHCPLPVGNNCIDDTSSACVGASLPDPIAVKVAEKKSKSLKSTFNSLVLDTKKELKKKGKITKFREEFILGLNYSLKSEHKKFLKETRLSKLSSIDEIFHDFNVYWDYLNYGLLEIMINEYGRFPLQTRMKQFLREVEAFRSSTTLKVFRKVERCGVVFELEGFTHIISKHRLSSDPTLEEINNLRLKLARHYSLQEFALSIPESVMGSVFITWLVPESAVNDLVFGLTAELMEELGIEAVALRHSTSPTHITSQKEMTAANKKLIEACKKGDEGRVRALLERGADIQAREDNELQRTPLMCATLNNHFGTVQLLLSHSLSDLMIDVQDTKGWTAFVLACHRRNLEMLQLLEDHGANIDHQNHEGWNGLMWAASKKGNLALTKHLLASGANTELRDYLDWTALMIASQSLSDKNIVQELLTHHANPNSRNEDGVTPLHIATNKNRDDIIEELLRSETVEVDAQDEKNDSTPLMIASQKGNNTIVKILLNNKAKPNIKAEKARGWTALFMAANKRRTDVVKTLLENGADATIKDKDGARVVDYAAKLWFSTDTYKVLLTATGLTAQEHKKQLQTKNFGSRLDSAPRMIDTWSRQVQDVLLHDKAAKRKAEEASQRETEAPAAAALAVH